MESLHKNQVAITDLNLDYTRGRKYLLTAWTPIYNACATTEKAVRDVDGVFDIKDQDRYAFSFKISHCFDQAVVRTRIVDALTAIGYAVVDPPEGVINSLQDQGLLDVEDPETSGNDSLIDDE